MDANGQVYADLDGTAPAEDLDRYQREVSKRVERLSPLADLNEEERREAMAQMRDELLTPGRLRPGPTIVHHCGPDCTPPDHHR